MVDSDWENDGPSGGAQKTDDSSYKDRKPRYNNNDNGDRPPRRFNRDGDGGDRPPRRFNNDGDGGDRPPRRFNRDGEDGDRPPRRFNRDGEDGGDRPPRRFNKDGEDGGDRPPRRFNKDKDGDGENGDGGERSEKPREIYIPPEPTNDEAEIFGAGIKSGANFAKYDQIEVQVSDKIEKPIVSFEAAGLRDLVLENLKKSGYTKPTPIQRYSIPTIMKGTDLMGCAQTGSGKTAAFLLPMITKLMEDFTCEPSKPKAIIISPTRELTIQIFNEARKFSLHSPLKVAIAYGGAATRYQNEAIMKGCHILVATPGRLNDFITRGWLTLDAIEFIVLDEADRMLDMGFKPEVEKVMNHPTMRAIGERQTLMFSATFPEDIQHMAGEFLKDYGFIAVGIIGSACTDVKQVIMEVKRFDKRKKLKEIIDEVGDPQGTLVFVETQRNTDFLASFLSETEFPTTSIHGGREQRERELALRDFTTGKMKILVATSVAARGLDIPGVKHVINFDLPKSVDEYVHRIGRTGRLGNQGRATSFFDPDNPQDMSVAPDLVRILKQAGEEIPACLESFGEGGTYKQSTFGAHDIRGGDEKKSAPKALEEEEEEW